LSDRSSQSRRSACRSVMCEESRSSGSLSIVCQLPQGKHRTGDPGKESVKVRLRPRSAAVAVAMLAIASCSFAPAAVAAPRGKAVLDPCALAVTALGQATRLDGHRWKLAVQAANEAVAAYAALVKADIGTAQAHAERHDALNNQANAITPKLIRAYAAVIMDVRLCRVYEQSQASATTGPTTTQ